MKPEDDGLARDLLESCDVPCRTSHRRGERCRHERTAFQPVPAKDTAVQPAAGKRSLTLWAIALLWRLGLHRASWWLADILVLRRRHRETT